MDRFLDIFVVALLVWLIGHSFINAFFVKKGELIDTMVNNQKGDE